MFEGHKKFATNTKVGNDQTSKKTPKTNKKKPTQDRTNERKRNASHCYYPKFIQESLDHQIRFLIKRSASKVILSNNNQTEDLFGDLPDSVFSNIKVDDDIKKVNFANPRRDTFAQFEYDKTKGSQNDTNKDFAEPCTEGKEVIEQS